MNKKMVPIGIYEKAIPNAFDWSKKIEVAKSAGFDFIEMSVDESDERLARLEWTKEKRKELRDLLYENNMYINSMCLSGHRRFPFGSSDELKRKRAFEIMDKALELAADLGIRNIQLAGYDVYYEEHTEMSERLFIEGLRYSAARAASYNIMLSIEIMDTEFIGTITRCLKYIDLVKSPWLKIYPDLGNLSQWTDSPETELEKGINHIVAIHLKDTKSGIFKCVPFGEGDVRFTELSNKLKELRYSGPFLIEMWADNDKEYTVEDSVSEVKQAKLWLEEQMKLGDFKC
jgi:L-ribulose-5-phosphate 3-epimerase/hexulose-6-phosphate isomerase